MSAEPTNPAAVAAPIAAPGARDVLGMYPALREDHIRYLQKWGFVTPAQRGGGTQFSFQDLSLLRQIHGELQRGVPFRAALRDLQSERQGQLTFDFRLDAEPARIIALARREPPSPAARSGPSARGSISTCRARRSTKPS